MEHDDAVHPVRQFHVMGRDKRRDAGNMDEAVQRGEHGVGGDLVKVTRGFSRSFRPSASSSSRARAFATRFSTPRIICGMMTFSSAENSGIRW